MNYKERIVKLEKEIEQFDYERLKRQEQAQQAQFELQQINEAILTRRGGIIELRKLVMDKK